MWPSLVINLAGNTARMANSAATLEALGLPYERIDAVNGWELSDAEIARVYDARANRRRARHALVRPEIGCYLSHIEAWRRIAEGPDEGGFVLEDDFHAGPDLAEVMQRLADDGGDGWDMVKFFAFDASPKTFARRPLGPDHELVEPYRVPSCLIGYALTRDGARKLAARAIPFFRPVDEDQKFVWETGLRVSLVLPAPITVGDQQTVTGTVGAERRALAPRNGPWQALRVLAYQARYRAAARRHWAGRSAK